MTVAVMTCPICSRPVELATEGAQAAVLRQRGLKRHLAADPHDIADLAHYAALYLLGGPERAW